MVCGRRRPMGNNGRLMPHNCLDHVAKKDKAGKRSRLHVMNIFGIVGLPAADPVVKRH